MLNRVELIGRLGRDPEVRNAGSKEVCNLSVATTEQWKDKGSGEKRERTEWHRVTIWSEGLVAFMKNHGRKGQLVYLSGQLQTRKWQDQAGNDRYTTEVVLQGYGAELKMLDWNNQGEGGGYDSQEPAGQSGSGDLDDEVPW